MRPIRLFVTPLDGSLIGDPVATAAFAEAWTGLPPDERPLLCFNTGRLSEDVLARIATGELPRPDYLISAVGTEIHELKTGRRR
ncbi:MAG: HAD family hydrolase, partial [Opitutales bacterium]